jgi:predicted metal-dependent hydrolase
VAPTYTAAVTPRWPGWTFHELRDDGPRAWHPAGLGPTVFLEALSAMAPVVESFFIDDARRLLPRVADERTRTEGEAFLRQEAAHASMHAAFNRILVRQGVPVEAVAHVVRQWLAIVDWTSSDLRSSVAMAGEHLLGEIGHALLSRPALLAGVDAGIARLFRWHGYEEVEHKAVLFDVFHAARGRGLYTYAVRITGLWIAVALLAVALPAAWYRILASAGEAHAPHVWRGLLRFLFGRDGMLRGCWRALGAYHRRAFHPWRYRDDQADLSDLRSVIVDPAWETGPSHA